MKLIYKAVVNGAVFKVTWQIQIIFSMTKAIGRKVSLPQSRPFISQIDNVTASNLVITS